MNNQFTKRKLVENRDNGLNLIRAEITEAAFHTEINVDFFENPLKHRFHHVRVGQEAATPFLVGHSWKWATHVKVDFLVTQLFALFGEAQNLLSIGAEDLWCQSFNIIECRVDFLALQVFRVFFFVNPCEKWRIELVDAAKMPLKHVAKRRIGDALERA